MMHNGQSNVTGQYGLMHAPPFAQYGIVDNHNDRKHINVQGSIGLCDMSLDTRLTNHLSTEANRLYGTEPLDLLIAALVLALHRCKHMEAYWL